MRDQRYQSVAARIDRNEKVVDRIRLVFVEGKDSIAVSRELAGLDNALFELLQGAYTVERQEPIRSQST
ncbi:MAG: hypothetical protein IH876_13495 [Gemmatimonadetes bacterium]|nr:hypothetical protein [Gemmatimonadota bacterium]